MLMSKDEMMDACVVYFMELAEKLKDTHEIVASCNQDRTMYLIPKGSIDQLSYYEKPVDSYRVSDHWNWYASTFKCSDSKLVQCYNVDLPWAKKRFAEGKATKPIYACQVAYFGDDKRYHHVFGEKYSRKEKGWDWVTE